MCILLNLCLVSVVFFPPDVPEFHALVGNEAADELQSSRDNPPRASLALKKCFSRMMNCEKKVFVDQLNMLVKRVSEEGKKKIVKYHLHLYVILCAKRDFTSWMCYLNENMFFVFLLW